MPDRPIPCQRCAADLGPISRRRAFLSVLAQGDEETRSWFFCEACRCWTIEFVDDRFLGDTTVSLCGPFAEDRCAADVALASTCPDPGDKWCDCAAHRQLGPG